MGKRRSERSGKVGKNVISMGNSGLFLISCSRDAIIESAGLELEHLDINLERKEKETLVTIRAKPRPASRAVPSVDSTELLGFILFKYDDKNLGVVQVANFKAKLREKHLTMGVTSKVGKSDQAGQHGEGLKLAALIFRRSPQNYSVRCTTSSRYLNFQLDHRRSLVCTVMKPDYKNLVKLKEREIARKRDGLPREAKANMWEDVMWEIGAVRPIDGGKKTARVPQQEFGNWLNMTLDIAAPTRVIQTPHGSLILDEKYAGRVCLSNLQLLNASACDLPYKYGYSLKEGRTNRDRESMSSARKEAHVIANI